MDFFLSLDSSTNLFFSASATANWLTFMNTVTNIISPETVSIVAAIGILLFLYKKSWKNALITAVSFGGGLGLSMLFKLIIMRARPESAFIVETGYSLPSNHAVAAAIFFTLIIYFFAPKIRSFICRNIFIAVSVFLALLTGFSRIYLGVHWLSDVVVGLLFGTLWTLLVIFLVKKYSDKALK